MKTIQISKRTQSVLLVGGVLTIFLSVALCSEHALGQEERPSITVAQIIQTYDEIEGELIRRFKSQIKEREEELTQTVSALAHIRSKKSIPFLLDNIELVPGRRIEKIGSFYPVRPAGSIKISDYVVLAALVDIGGVSIYQCLAKLEESERRSVREFLLFTLGRRLHGKSFIEELRKRSEASEEQENKKWMFLLDLLPEE